MRKKRVVVFIEGRNFYVGSKGKSAYDSDINYAELKKLLTELSGGDIHFLRYYLGVDDNSKHLTVEASARIDRSVKSLTDVGYEVRTFPLRTKSYKCQECGDETIEIVEKQIDSAIAVDAITAALDKTLDIDLFILISSDTDQLPLIQALKDLKKDVWVVVWSKTAAPAALSTAATTVVELDPHRSRLIQARLKLDSTVKIDPDVLLQELSLAEQQFSSGYVGMHYFLTHWRSPKLPKLAAERSVLLNDLIKGGKVLQYEATDGNMAIKRAEQ